MSSSPAPDPASLRPDPSDRRAWAEYYRAVRALSLRLAAPLSPEDQGLQGMPDASPTKWHLAHTTWFFETVVLAPWCPGYRPVDARYAYLFNSYYESLGPRQPRPERGLLSRPGIDAIHAYRQRVDATVAAWIADCDETAWGAARPLLELGLHHEQQHQELILTDIKFGLSRQPFDPVYEARPFAPGAGPGPAGWLDFPGGRVTIGAPATGFAYDNERPRHDILLAPYQLADRPVTCGDYLAFIADGGYQRPEFWLADGWNAVAADDWQAPLYWRPEGGGEWSVFTLHGRRPVDPAEPVCHVSFYEAAAYAAWAGARLPTEGEWEAAVAPLPVAGNFLDPAGLHPRAATPGPGLRQAFGDVWTWTRSAYDPYPGFRPLPGAVGEYNGKFMVGQLVLRGGSCASPPGHLRASYRNFFPPAARWQFSGLRLARDA